MEDPWSDRVYRLIREFAADAGLPPTPSAEAVYLAGPGKLQVGSFVDDRCGVIWFRPLKGGRWYVDRAA